MDVVVSAAALLPTYNMPPPPTQKPTHTASFDDTRLWCVDCGCTIPGLRCKTHGDTTHIRDRTIPCRAKLTAPHLITIRTVELRPGEHNKFAVFAKKVIQKRTEFGPYEGAPQNVWRYGISPERDRLMLKLFKSDGSSHFLDCTDETYCNWMMYIRPASNHAEQNLAAFQCKGAIYYVSTKAISPNVELRVWYTDPYAAAMGYPVHRPMSIVQVDPYAAAHTRIVPYRDDDDDDEDDDEDDDAISVTTGNMSHDVHDYDDEDDHDDDPDYKCTEVIINTKGNHNGRGFELMGSFTQDGRFECNKCHSLFDSMLECQNHPCVTEDIPPKAKSPPPLPDPAAMRRKRKINPSKAVPEVTPVPKKKGRPPKLNNVKGIGKGTGRPRGRPKGSTNSAAKVRRRPLKVRTPKTLHECDLCGKAFLNDSKLKVHMFTHSGERPFLCSFDSCDKAFTSKFKVMRHELIHASDRQHVCIYCLKTFSRKDHLKHHLRIHDPNKSMHQCEECGKMYASSYAYRTHLAFHAADRGQMTCAVCKEDFADKETLKKHLKAHAGARSIKDSTEKRQKCDFCDKTFFTIKDVKRHAVVHTKDRDYLCQYCPQKFGRRDHLVRHLKKTHVRSSVTGEISNVGTTAITITQPKKEGKKVSESINTMATVVQLVQPEQQAQIQVQVQTQQQMQNQVQQQTQQIIHQPVPQETQHNAQQIVQQQAQHLAQQSAQHAQQQAQQQAQLLTQQLQQQQAQQQQAQQQLLQKQQLHLQKQQLAQQQQDAQQEQLLQQKVQQQHQLQQQVQLQQQEQQPELAQTSEVPQLAAVSQVPQLAGNSGDTLESQRLLLDPAMISKLIQSVARGIPDPSMVPDDIGTSHQPQPQPQAETHAQAVQQQQSAVSLQSGNGALQVQTVSLQLQQQRQAAQLKGKNILGSLSHVTGSNVSQALPNVITSIGMLPGSLLNYQNIGSISVTSPVQTLPTLSTATSTTAAATMAAATASRTARIASIAQQLAEPVMSGHFVPPFLPASTLTQTQPTQMIKDTPVQVQPITAVSLLAQQQIQLQQLQQQHLRQHQQQAQQQDQQQKQQAQQQQQQHIIEQPSGTVSSAPSVLAVNSVNTPLLSDGQMHLPIIHPQFITRAEGTQLRLATHANNTQQVQLIRAAPTSQVTQSALSKQMVVVTPLPSSGLGATNIQLSGGHVVTNYADAMKLVLSQLSQSQQTQQQAQQQLVQQQQQQQQQAQQQQQVIQQQQDSQPQTPPQI